MIAWLAALALWPLAWRGLGGPARFMAGATALIVGLGLALIMHMTSPWTARYPQAAEPLYVVAPQTSRAWLVDQVTPGAWSRSWLTAGDARPGLLRLPGLTRPVDAVPVSVIAAPAPAVSVERAADGVVTLRATPAAHSLSLRLDLDCDTVLADGRVNGRPLATLTTPGHWTHLRWETGSGGFTVSFRPVGPGVLSLRWAQYLPGWPAGTKTLPTMPKTVMAWDLAGSTVVVGSQRVKL